MPSNGKTRVRPGHFSFVLERAVISTCNLSLFTILKVLLGKAQRSSAHTKSPTRLCGFERNFLWAKERRGWREGRGQFLDEPPQSTCWKLQVGSTEAHYPSLHVSDVHPGPIQQPRQIDVWGDPEWDGYSRKRSHPCLAEFGHGKSHPTNPHQTSQDQGDWNLPPLLCQWLIHIQITPVRTQLHCLA